MSLFSKTDEVVRYDIGFESETGAPAPVLLQSDLSAFLTFNAVRMNRGQRETVGIGVVEILGCSITKFGYPNDEALGGHPLWKRGLRAYGVFEVKSSSWIRDKTEQNRICFPKTGDSEQRHFIFTFHDSMFECIADDLRGLLSTEPHEHVFGQIASKVLKENGD